MHVCMFQQLRYDKYEKKTKYWVEEDLEFEWEKSTKRGVEEEHNFNVDGDDWPDMGGGGGSCSMQADLAIAAASEQESYMLPLNLPCLFGMEFTLFVWPSGTTAMPPK